MALENQVIIKSYRNYYNEGQVAEESDIVSNSVLIDEVEYKNVKQQQIVKEESDREWVKRLLEDIDKGYFR